MLIEAETIASSCNGKEIGDNSVVNPLLTNGKALERAANLAEHAAAELRDEYQKALGWHDPI